MDSEGNRWPAITVGVLFALVLLAAYLRDHFNREASSAYDRQDFTTAATRYTWACKLRVADACFNLALLYRDGHGVPQDDVRAVDLYRRACDAKHANACNNLAVHYQTGRGVALDEELALRLFQQACDGAELDSLNCTNAGLLALKLERANLAESFLRRGCLRGGADACESLASELHSGELLQKNETESDRLFRLGCDGKRGLSCFNAGINDQEGALGAKEEVRARSLFKRACDLDYPDGCTNLGFLLYEGKGGSRDAPAAFTELGRGCSKGDPIGCRKLRYLLFFADAGTDGDRARATDVFAAGCDAGVGAGCVGAGSAFSDDTYYLAGCELGESLGCGAVLGSLDLRPRVRAALEAIIAAHPDDAEALMGRAWLAMDEGKNAESLSDYDAALKLEPDDQVALNNRGWVHVRLGDFAAARADAERSAELESGPEALGTLCFALYGLGEKKAALERCKQALAMSPGEALNEGMVALIQGKGDVARRRWDEAVKVSPAEAPIVERWLGAK